MAGEFLGFEMLGPEISDGGGENEQVVFGELGENRSMHLSSGLNVNPRQARGDGDGDGAENDRGGVARFNASAGESGPHFSAGAVADEADGVDGFVSGAGGEKDAHGNGLIR